MTQYKHISSIEKMSVLVISWFFEKSKLSFRKFPEFRNESDMVSGAESKISQKPEIDLIGDNICFVVEQENNLVTTKFDIGDKSYLHVNSKRANSQRTGGC